MADQITLAITAQELWAAVGLCAGAVVGLGWVVVQLERARINRDLTAVQATQKEQFDTLQKTVGELSVLITRLTESFHVLDKELAVVIALRRGDKSE